MRREEASSNKAGQDGGFELREGKGLSHFVPLREPYFGTEVGFANVPILFEPDSNGVDAEPAKAQRDGEAISPHEGSGSSTFFYCDSSVEVKTFFEIQ